MKRGWRAGCTRLFATGLLKTCGWRISATPLPDKCIIIGAPHTSNRDGVLMVLCALHLHTRFQFLGKDSLFRPPFGWFMRAIGGIPVNRAHPGGLAGSLAEQARSHERFQLALAPEATRKAVPYWKSGFYRIARAADLPVVLAYIDAPRKTLGIGKTIHLTGNVRADMDAIRAFYADKVGFHPEKMGEIRLREELEASAEPPASPQ